MRIFSLFFLCAFMVGAQESSSHELNWFAKHKRVIAAVAVNGIALGINAAGLKHCRQGDVENCTGHYGAAWGTYGTWAGVTGVFFVLGEVAHKDGNHTLGNLLEYIPPAYNVAWGVNEWHQYAPEKDSTSSFKIDPLWIRKIRR